MTDKVAFSNDKKVISLFQLDVLVADQFAATFRARDSLGPEKRLILAVLEEATHCFQKYMSAARFACAKCLAKKIWLYGQAWVGKESQYGRERNERIFT